MENTNKFNLLKWKLYTQTLLKLRFFNIGKHSIIFSPMRIDSPQTLEIGHNVFISNNSWLIGKADSKNRTLYIGENTIIGNYSHIVALENIVIEPNVLIADKVFIADTGHEYRNPLVPIRDQGMQTAGSVRIGEGSWIGESVSIIGASIGRNCVIGANSVVTHDIPDYSIAVGAPAKVIKYYNFEKKVWFKVEA